MSDTDLPEPDRAPGAPHPRDTEHIFGQALAEQEFLRVYNAGRLHHGWLLTGPKGTGKASLAWRIARFLLATPPVDEAGLFGAPPPPSSLDVSADHPVSHRLRALSEPGLFLLRRGLNEKGDKLASEIRVDEVRKLKGFFNLSAADGGRRVVIVDAADELNANAANAILKLLEEPPARTTLLLVSHQPARLLPTIRSRCRALRLTALAPEPLHQALTQAGATPLPEHAPALAQLAGGSVGAALRLITLDGVTLYGELLTVLGSLPALDRPRLLALANSCAGKDKEARLDLFLGLSDVLTARLARCGVTGMPPPEALPNEAQILTRLSPDPLAGRAWARLSQKASDRARHARAVNIDAMQLVLDHVLHLQTAVQGNSALA